jgi:peroxiredoxin
MKKVVLIAIAVLIISLKFGYSQNVSEKAMTIDENTLIKDESGNILEFSTFTELMHSGEWMINPVFNDIGEMLYIQLKIATEEEKKMMANMPKQGGVSEMIGKSAPAFHMEDINGNSISSEEVKGKVIVLNFWFTACKPCIAEIPDLNEVYEKFEANENVIFASVTFNETKEVRSFLETYPLQYPVVANAREICNLFKVSRYPTNIVIDKKGNYFDILTGGSANIGRQISNSIQNALDNKGPGPASPVPAGGIRLAADAIFLLENGDTVSEGKLLNLLNSNEYELEEKEDDAKNKYYLLKKK